MIWCGGDGRIQIETVDDCALNDGNWARWMIGRLDAELGRWKIGC